MDLEVETPLPQGVTGLAVSPVREAAPKIAVDVVKVVDDVAGDLTIGGLRVRIEDLPIESAQSEEVRQFGQTRWSCIDRRRRVWLRLALTGSAPSLNGTEVSGS